MSAEDAKDCAHWEAVEEATELLHEERFREAMVSLRNVITRDAKNSYAYYFLGIAFFEVGELEPSRDAYRACLAIAPKHLGARVALTHVLRQMGDLREALKEGLAALSQAPGDADALHAIGLGTWPAATTRPRAGTSRRSSRRSPSSRWRPRCEPSSTTSPRAPRADSGRYSLQFWKRKSAFASQVT